VHTFKLITIITLLFAILHVREWNTKFNKKFTYICGGAGEERRGAGEEEDKEERKRKRKNHSSYGQKNVFKMIHLVLSAINGINSNYCIQMKS
jgi:hypothetical protein